MQRFTSVVVWYNSALSPFPKLEMQHDKERKRRVLILFGKTKVGRVEKGVC
jgi:hypothetical protein